MAEITEEKFNQLVERVDALEAENKELKADLKESSQEEAKEQPKVVSIKVGKDEYEAPRGLKFSYYDKDADLNRQVTAQDLADDEKLAKKFVGKIKSIKKK